MRKSIEKRIKLLERRLSQLEARKKKPKTRVITAKIGREDQMLIDIGLAHILFHISDTVRRHPDSDEYDDMLRDIFKQGITPETRYSYASKTWERGMASLEKAAKQVRVKKAQEPPSA